MPGPASIAIYFRQLLLHLENSYYLSLASLRLVAAKAIKLSNLHLALLNTHIHIYPFHTATCAFPGSLSSSLIPSQFIFMLQIAVRFPSTSSSLVSWGFAVICVLYSCRWSKAKVSSEAVKLSNIFQHLSTNDKISRTLSSVFPHLSSPSVLISWVLCIFHHHQLVAKNWPGKNCNRLR